MGRPRKKKEEKEEEEVKQPEGEVKQPETDSATPNDGGKGGDQVSDEGDVVDDNIADDGVTGDGEGGNIADDGVAGDGEDINDTDDETLNEDQDNDINDQDDIKDVEDEVPTLTLPEIRTFLNEIDSLEAAYDNLKRATPVAATINALQHYNNDVFETYTGQPTRIAAANYNLYRLFINIASIKDINEMKLNLDLLLAVFKAEPNKFNAVSLSRYDLYWSQGVETFKRYTGIVKLYTMIVADGEKAKKVKALYGSDNILGLFPEEARPNIIRYFGL